MNSSIDDLVHGYEAPTEIGFETHQTIDKFIHYVILKNTRYQEFLHIAISKFLFRLSLKGDFRGMAQSTTFASCSGRIFPI